MYDPRNDRIFEYQQNNEPIYQEQILRSNLVETQSGILVSKFMALLAFLFLFATIGAFIGINIVNVAIISIAGYFFIALAGLIILFTLRFIEKSQQIKLFLLTLFIFLEGLALSPILVAYIADGSILGKSFLIIAVTFACLALYIKITKYHFAHIQNYLFLILILLVVTGIVVFFLSATFFSLFIAFFCMAIFCCYALYYAQNASPMLKSSTSAIDFAISFFTLCSV